MSDRLFLTIWKNQVLKFYVRIGTFPGQKVRPPTKRWEEATESEEQLIKDGYTNVSDQFQTLFEVTENAKP